MGKQYLDVLIERLVLKVVCSGYQGCSICDALFALGLDLRCLTSSGVLGHSEQQEEIHRAVPTSSIGGSSSLLDHGVETIWHWIATRPDVLVGSGREWNHLTLSVILSLPEDDQVADADSSQSSQLPRTRPRLYVSDDKLWKCLAGHSEDYQKLPKYEWLALVGIASSMENGMIQGDLTKLTGQDKRSLPKRTDALARKGYIEKRPVLARGCKTSKLWVKRFAPAALPVDGEAYQPAAAAGKPTFDWSPESFLNDLEPVPWRTAWTGEAIDYALLARTIMAIVKAFGVMRYGDLRRKLGVTGHTWQMKVVARTCRSLMRAGALQYVVATLESVVYSDCVKFMRDITSEDINSFVSNTGSAFRVGSSQPPQKATAASSKDAKGRPLPTELWNSDKPLTTSVLDVVMQSGENGITNQGIAFRTLGRYCNRHVGTAGAAVSINNLQPGHLRRFQSRRVYCRHGRQAAFRIFPSEVTPPYQRADEEPSPDSVPSSFCDDFCSREMQYGFRPVNPTLKYLNQACTVRGSCKRKRLAASPTPAEAPPLKRRREGPRRLATKSAEVAPSSGENNEGEEGSPGGEGNGDKIASTVRTVTDFQAGDEDVEMTEPGPSAVRTNVQDLPPKPLSRKTKRTANKPWLCEKCGGSWKNLAGLTYHLKKAQVTCNPDFAPSASSVHQGAAPRESTNAAASIASPSSFRAACPLQRDTERHFARATGLDRHNSVRTRRHSVGEQPARGCVERSSFARPTPRSGSPVTRVRETLQMSATKAEPETSPRAETGGFIRSCLAALRDGLAKVPASQQSGSLGDALSEANKTVSPAVHHSGEVQPGQAALPRDALQPLDPNELGAGEPFRIIHNHAAPVKAPVKAPVGSGEPESDQQVPSTPDMKADCRRLPESSYSELPPFQMPEAADGLEGDVLTQHRVEHIVRYLIHAHNDAFPSRASIWYAVAAVYKKAFPYDRIPDSKITQRAVRHLIKRKEMEENTFAFRHPSAGSGSTFLLVKAGVNPNQARFDALKTLMKECYPKPYVPPAFVGAGTAAATAQRGKTSFRRPGLGSVEVLDAPFYASRSRQTSTRFQQFGPSRERTRYQCSLNRPVSAAPGHAGHDGALEPTVQQLGLPAAQTKAVGVPHYGPGPTVFVEPVRLQQQRGYWPELGMGYFESAGASFEVVGLKHILLGPISWAVNKHAFNSREPERIGAKEELWASPVDRLQSGQRWRADPRRSIIQKNPVSVVEGKERMLSGIQDATSAEYWLGVPAIRQALSADYEKDEILMATFVATKTLLGGFEQRVDWGLLCLLLPGMPPRELQRFWLKLQKDKNHALATATRSFQEAFPAAYENGDVPAIDFDNLTAADWLSLIRWTAQLNRDNFIKLPTRRRGDVEGGNEVSSRAFQLHDRRIESGCWHDKFFQPQASVFGRFEMATADANALVIDAAGRERASFDVKPSPAQVASSWVKALCVTPVGKCTPDLIRAKFSSLATGDKLLKLLDEVVTDLNARRVIKKRHRLRPYQLSKPFETSLAKQSHESKFCAATQFKTLLDETFKRGDHFKVPLLMEDGASMALINLVAHERVLLIGDDIPDIPFGFEPGNYDSRRMPKTNLLFGLHLEPTPTYAWDEDIAILAKARAIPPPCRGPEKMIPLWYDFLGDLVPSIWVRVLGMVCFVLETRGCMTVDILHENTRAHLDRFEVQLIVDWGVDVGLLFHEGGYMVTEWWWLVVARQRTWLEPVEYTRDEVRLKGLPGLPRKRRGRPRRDEEDSELASDLFWAWGIQNEAAKRGAA